MPASGQTCRRHDVLKLFVRSFVCYETCEHDILKMNKNDFDASWHKWFMGQRHETVNFGGQEVKGQGHTRPTVNIKA